MKFNVPTKDSGVIDVLAVERQVYKIFCSSQALSIHPLYFEELKKNLKFVNPNYLAKLAVFCRKEMNFRISSLILAAYLVRNGYINIPVPEKIAINKLLSLVVQRPDDLGELVKICSMMTDFPENSNKKHTSAYKIPNQLKKFIKDCFEQDRFSEYQIRKYKNDGDITLRDLLFLCRPKPKNPAQSELFAKLANKKLEAAETHERLIGNVNNSELSDEAKRVEKVNHWMNLIENKKVSHIALLREMKHILQLRVNSLNVKAVTLFVETADKSKMMPYVYMGMYREIAFMFGNTSDEALLLSFAVFNILKNKTDNMVDILPGFKHMVLDISGSMESVIHDKTKMTRLDALMAYTIVLKKSMENIIVFGQNAADWRTHRQCSSVKEMQDKICSLNINRGGTNLQAAFDLLETCAASDEGVIVFTDEEYNLDLRRLASFDKFKKILIVNLADSKGGPLEIKGTVAKISGISDASFLLYKDLVHTGRYFTALSNWYSRFESSSEEK